MDQWCDSPLIVRSPVVRVAGHWKANTDIPFGGNETFSIGTPVGGTVVLPLQTYYVRTGGALRAGTVAADANFSVTFQ